MLPSAFLPLMTGRTAPSSAPAPSLLIPVSRSLTAETDRLTREIAELTRLVNADPYSAGAWGKQLREKEARLAELRGQAVGISSRPEKAPTFALNMRPDAIGVEDLKMRPR
jgi:hypothetical protein